MRCDQKIFPSDRPGDVDKLLTEKWGISLFKFAQVFAVSPADLLLLRNDYPFSSKEIKTIRRNLKAMKDEVIYRGRLISGITNKLWGPSAKRMSDEELIKHMGLEDFLNKYIRNHEEAISYASRLSLQGKRGGSINHKSIIAVGWGNLIAGKCRRMDWLTLGDLYYWFWAKVADYGFYLKLKPSENIEEYLRHQYLRYRWTHGEILEKAGFKKIREVLEFIGILFSHQFLGGKAGYLEKRLSLRASEFPKFYMNFVIDYYLAGREGLTIFSTGQAMADPGYKLLDVSLGRKVGTKKYFRLLKWMFPRSIDFSEDQELPFQDTGIGEYFRRAANLYVENKISLDRLIPLIIFPDKSFFSTGF